MDVTRVKLVIWSTIELTLSSCSQSYLIANLAVLISNVRGVGVVFTALSARSVVTEFLHRHLETSVLLKGIGYFDCS